MIIKLFVTDLLIILMLKCLYVQLILKLDLIININSIVMQESFDTSKAHLSLVSFLN